jgi:hypothetical protein
MLRWGGRRERTRRSASSTLNGLVVVSTSSCAQFVPTTASMPTCSIAWTTRVKRRSLPFACCTFCPEMFFLMYSTSFISLSRSDSKTSTRCCQRFSRSFK